MGSNANSAEHHQESRFQFGANWRKYLSEVDDFRIGAAVTSLRKMLYCDSLEGTTFLDIGSGSGLFSLAARTLGATVHSFDYDAASVQCTLDLKGRYFPRDERWKVEQASVLDTSYTGKLGQFDTVYSWGVLHHTGAMWAAVENAAALVRPGGKLFISIYNDQGGASRRWLAVKRAYNRLPPGLRWTIVAPSFARLWLPTVIRDCMRGAPLRSWRSYASHRGMSPLRDVIDWVGGYPFEVAKPEEVFRFCRDRGFDLRELVTCGKGLGCNEYVFQLTQRRA